MSTAFRYLYSTLIIIRAVHIPDTKNVSNVRYSKDYRLLLLGRLTGRRPLDSMLMNAEEEPFLPF